VIHTTMLGVVGAAVNIQLVLQVLQGINLIITGTFTSMKNVHKKSENSTLSLSLFHNLDCALFQFTLIGWLDLLYLVNSNRNNGNVRIIYSKVMAMMKLLLFIFYFIAPIFF